jgi:hypothetical protein
MCCFTQPVISVNDTRIFARPDKDHHQFIVYRMQFEAKNHLAMVLPIPVKHGSGEKAVTFLNLERYPDFFDDMESGFPPPPVEGTKGDSMSPPAAASSRMLEVIQVGDFEASFVPTEKDFSRLDPRFRLPAGVWAKLGDYRDWGFAVFKLKPGHQNVHPMAFTFPRRDPQTLFFPTVHIHDGKVHPEADFDHTLYCQLREGEPMKHSDEHEWRESPAHARSFIKTWKSLGIVEPDAHCFRTTMRGDLPNKDTIIPLED